MKYIPNIIIFSLLIVSLNCSFQSTLFNRMNKKEKGKNLIISPLSIFQGLSLAANAAKGETQSEILELLQYDTIEELNKVNYEILSAFKNFTTIEIASAIMTKFTPLEEFTDTAKKYLAPVEPLVSADQVNDWCSNKTHGKITKILDKLDPSLLMILINAVYFKGIWSSKFTTSSTKKLPFYNLGSEEVTVDTMNKFEYKPYYEDKNVQAIELKFERDNMSAIIILPANGTDVNTYINYISKSNGEYKKIIEGLKSAKVRLQLPKFELRFEESLNQILMDLGMYNAFSAKDADFTGLTEETNLFIGKVMHKTYLKVFEEGCEATGMIYFPVYGSALNMNEVIYEMKIDRPFLFLLRNAKLPAGHDLVFISKIEKIN